jgi:hypothetical protein
VTRSPLGCHFGLRTNNLALGANQFPAPMCQLDFHPLTFEIDGKVATSQDSFKPSNKAKRALSSFVNPILTKLPFPGVTH